MKPVSPVPRMLTVADVAERLALSTKTVRRAIAARDLHVHVIGRQHRVAEEDLMAFIAQAKKVMSTQFHQNLEVSSRTTRLVNTVVLRRPKSIACCIHEFLPSSTNGFTRPLMSTSTASRKPTPPHLGAVLETDHR